MITAAINRSEYLLDPGDELLKTCNTGNTVTLDWLINDFVEHLEHHLAQILKY